MNGYAAVNVTASRTLHRYVENLISELVCFMTTIGLTSPIVRSSTEVIQDIKLLQLSHSDLWLVTFDFESLYTNIKK